jgi:hypothetical protein
MIKKESGAKKASAFTVHPPGLMSCPAGVSSPRNALSIQTPILFRNAKFIHNFLRLSLENDEKSTNIQNMTS